MRILTVDQSYTHTGLCIADGTTIIAYPTCTYPRWIIETRPDGSVEKRKLDKRDKRRMLVSLIKSLAERHGVQAIVVERVRTHAQGKISPATTKALHAMVTAIVDAVELPVLAVDTRSWKSKTLGNPSATKTDAVAFASQLVHAPNPLDDDTADAICMALAVARGVKLDKVE
jgi:Holliday junction resolvasome RuvABC endonuclease subunit